MRGDSSRTADVLENCIVNIELLVLLVNMIRISPIDFNKSGINDGFTFSFLSQINSYLVNKKQFPHGLTQILCPVK